ncbi:MAG: 30S ribosomal protein S20 [Chloroflexi bacterium]|nr:MAG: 30S ribosomal protein S20 [Chloroflexota bacterium]
MAKRTASAKKQARASVRRSIRNRAVRSEVKTKIVKARRSLTEAPVAESERYAIALEAVRALDRAASKGILHRNNAARRKARLTRQLVKLGGMPAAAGKASGKRGAAPAPAAKAPDKKAAAKKK